MSKPWGIAAMGVLVLGLNVVAGLAQDVDRGLEDLDLAVTGDARTARVRRVPVLTNDGSLAGIISQGDVLRHVGPGDPIGFERTMQHVYAGSTFVR